MPQLGSDERPVAFRQTIASKESRTRKGFDKQKYDANYDRIFGSKTEFEIARETSKTFSAEQS